jgi:hypothetical protein
MLLSRVWFLVLAVAAVLGLSTALLARGVIDREQVSFVDEQLRRDRFASEMLLKLDARARLDALAPIAADSTVREALRGKRVDGQDPAKALRERLRSMNQRLEEMRADLLIAVDASGVILGQEGRKPPRAGAGLGRVPLVERALSGFLGDDVWVYDGIVYRVAARPVIDRGVYIGAVVHGQKLDAVLAQRMSERLGGATVGFFHRDRVLATYTPTDRPGAPTLPELTAQLAAARADERLKRGERTEPLDLAERGRAVFSLVAGSASAVEVGYVVARGYSTLPTPWAIFDRAKKEDVDALPKLALALGLLGLFAVAMGIMYLERDRPLAIFRGQVDRIAEGKSEELDLAQLIRQHRKIAESIHKAIDTMVQKGGGERHKPKANLDEILGPAPENLTSSAFSFGGESKSAAVAQPVALPPPGSSAGKMPPPPAPKAPPAPPPPKAAANISFDEKSVALRLDALGPLAKPSNGNAGYASPDEESHFREVFSKFVAMRKQCGEPTGDLTYERFLGTLQKHRDAIMHSRPEARGVRFTVYEKEGRAALKAAPRKA